MIYTITEDDLDRRLRQQVYSDFDESIFEHGQEAIRPNQRKYYAWLLAELALFVEAAAAEEEVPFVPKIESTGELGYDSTRLVDRYFRRIPEFIRIVTMLSDRYSYSEHIDLFIEACDGLGLNDTTMIREDTWHPALPLRSNGMKGAEAFNAIVAILRRDWTEKGYKTRFRRRVRESRERSKQYQAHVDAWFGELATIIVLRVDLYYKKEHWDEITLDDVTVDLDHLYANFRCNKIFKGRRGYIAKIEYGLGKGFHVHMIFLYDTEHKQAIRHVFLAKQIGEYWVNTITKGRGDY